MGTPSLTPAAPTPRPAPSRQRAVLWALVAILWLVFATRSLRLNGLNMQKDEVWSVWQTLGTVQDTLTWTPYDWSPAYYLTVHAWRVVAGISPFALRIMTVLTMLITTALMFRLGKRLFNTTVALLATLAFGGLGYVLFLSTILRAYTLGIALFLAAMLLMLRYFERPSRLGGLLLGLTLTAMFYIHVTAIFAFAMMALFSLLDKAITFRRWLTLWLWPGGIALVLGLPEAIMRVTAIPIKARIVDQFIPYTPEPIRLYNHYLDYVGAQPALWGALFLIASLLLFDRWRFNRRTLTMALWIIFPVFVLIVGQRIDAFNVRHIPWVMVGVALWLGWGLALLPRPALVGLALVLAGCSFDRIPISDRYEPYLRIPLVTSFDEIKKLYRNGDVFYVDPTCRGCIVPDPEEWDYFGRAYFPNSGITLVKSPDGYRRVWYISVEGQEDPTAFAQLTAARAHSYSVGEANMRFRLYETPPDPVGIAFENGMKFHGAEFLNDGRQSIVWHEGDTVRVRLFWSAGAVVKLDYSAAVFIMNPQQGVVGQVDSPPLVLNAPRETSRWISGQYVVEERLIKLNNPIPTGDQQVKLAVYFWQDQRRLSAPGVDQDGLLSIGQIFIKSL